jgi:hypothetical protein
MWPEVVRATVYLHNRTPNYRNNWKSPYEALYTRIGFQNGTAVSARKPNLAHLKVYGCKAFAMTDDTQLGRFRLQRLDPKAWIGYLVGYRSSNIFRIWVPSLGKVISTRDVVFDESTFFNGSEQDIMENLMHSTTEQIARWVKTLELPEPTHNPPETQTFFEDEPSTETMTGSVNGSSQTQDLSLSHNETPKQVDGYPSPSITPPPAALLTQLLSELKMDQKASTQVSAKTVPWQAAFMAGTQAGIVGTYEGKQVDKAKIQRLLAQGVKRHLQELPELLTPFSKLEEHEMAKQFKEAEEVHLQSHRDMESWTEVAAAPVKRRGQQVLDCMWVYTYKLDKEHRLVRCKARLVVRGDQQRNITAQDTYAATLASRSFRLLMAIAAKYNLELRQYDITNAFVHALLDREVYMRMPQGYRKPGTILKLQKALYGLRISPLLWQKEFTATLTRLGFKPVPHEPCCMIRDGIIIFFYVDDIIFAYDRQKNTQYQEIIKSLQKEYTMTGGEELQWFLGMEIIRDRDNHLIHLSQAAYLQKISRLVDDRSVRHDTPMAAIELKPYEGLATLSEVNKYQRKIGSQLFAATSTRPDIAFAVSRLARFLVNPSPEHHRAADRVLLYLQATKDLTLQLSNREGLQVASDASFADNTIDRRSSQGYAIKLFGGLIAWRASKQDTVTTSTTEAELLALAQVAKEAMYLSRLIRELGLNIPGPISIQCDNQQTIRLVNEEIARLVTKLRHVDIHNHWIRQKTARGTISVIYTPTAEMIADGLTKTLPVNKWQPFLKQLGLVTVRHCTTKKACDLNTIKDRINEYYPA